MTKSPNRTAAMSRRRFVALVAAGSAALIAPGTAAAAPAAKPAPRRAPAGTAPGLAPADRKELLRQRAATQATLEVIRGHAMRPGTEMASVFHPIKPRRNG